jgi:hypothetical protein
VGKKKTRCFLTVSTEKSGKNMKKGLSVFRVGILLPLMSMGIHI